MLTLADIKGYKALVAKHPDNVASKIITHLLGELSEARQIIFKLRSDAIDKRGAFTKDTLMPFGQYKGEPLELVPPDYFKWWAGQPENLDRESIEIDMRFKGYPEKAFAIQRLKLYDYIHSMNGNGSKNGNGAHIQQEGH